MKGGKLTRLVMQCALLVFAGPLLTLLVQAVSLRWPFPSLLPTVISVRHAVNLLWDNPRLTEAVASSLGIAFMTTIFTLLLAFPAAKALGVYNFPGKEAVKLLALLPIMVPTATVTMGLHTGMIRMGLAGTFVGVAIVHTVFTLPYALRILMHVFELVGDRHEQQAAMLGASWGRVFYRITLPLVIPGALSAATMSFIISFSQYITTFMIGGGRIITLPLYLVPHVQGGEWHVASVYSLVFVVATLGALTLMQYLVRRYYRETYFLSP